MLMAESTTLNPRSGDERGFDTLSSIFGQNAASSQRFIIGVGQDSHQFQCVSHSFPVAFLRRPYCLILVTETSITYSPGLSIDENTEIGRKHLVDFLSYYVGKEVRVMLFPAPGTDMTFPSRCCILKDAECEQHNGRERMPSSRKTPVSGRCPHKLSHREHGHPPFRGAERDTA